MLTDSAIRYDAIVIGGGPAGSSTALALAKAGRTVALVERAEFPRRKVCGEFMSGANAAVLREMGLHDVWRDHAGPEIRRVGLHVGRRMVDAPMPRLDGADPYGRALGRDVVDGLVLEAARGAGAEIFQPWRATRLDRTPGGWRLSIGTRAESATIEAPVLVAAHGSWEPGPLPTQSGKRNAPSDLLGFKAHFRDAGLPSDLMPLIVFPGGYGGMVQADGGRLSLSCCIRRDVLERLRAERSGPAGPIVRAHIERRCRGVREALDGAALEGEWLGAGPIRPGIRPAYEGDIFRVGNVAGEAHPIVAEGISMALQAGWLLGRELAAVNAADPAAREEAGRRYAAAWRAQFATRIHAASIFAHLLTRRPGAALAGPLVSAWPRALTLGAAFSGKAKPLPGM